MKAPTFGFSGIRLRASARYGLWRTDREGGGFHTPGIELLTIHSAPAEYLQTLQAATRLKSATRKPAKLANAMRFCVLHLLVVALSAWSVKAQSAAATDFDSLRAQFAAQVDRTWEVPLAERTRYIGLLQQALSAAGKEFDDSQAFVLVDRDPLVQAIFVIVWVKANDWQWIGAAPVSTGKVGTFEHFVTPIGVFAHTLDNPDFRAEGTFNKNRIRGYGRKGLRVFDFGWQMAQRGWGKGGTSSMRLQMHATDPDVLESRLGTVQSEGCIRIPSSLNIFLDRNGILDADYNQSLQDGDRLWVIRPDHQAYPWAGRYLVVVDSQSTQRPAWLPVLSARAR